MLVTVLRGLSGSGKTTWATKREEAVAEGRASPLVGAVVVSADQHLVFGDTYQFGPALVKEAHATCLRQFVSEATTYGKLSPRQVIVDNTNCSLAEIAPYCAIAQAYKHELQILEFTQPVDVCLHRNIHRVPLEVLAAQAANMTISKAHWPRWWPPATRVESGGTPTDSSGVRVVHVGCGHILGVFQPMDDHSGVRMRCQCGVLVSIHNQLICPGAGTGTSSTVRI